MLFRQPKFLQVELSAPFITQMMIMFAKLVEASINILEQSFLVQCRKFKEFPQASKMRKIVFILI